MAPSNEINFGSLVDVIRHVHEHLAAQAGRAVNVSLTLRNWMIGFYIREYEQEGVDRAEYGDGLLDRLADRLREKGMSRVDSRELRRYRQFYGAYSWIGRSLTPEFRSLFPDNELRLPGGEPESGQVPRGLHVPAHQG